MIKEEKISGDRVYLRQLKEADATPAYCGWLNDSEINQYLETRQSTIDDLKKYIRKQLADPNSFFVGIFDKENDKHIGNIKLEPIDWENKKAIFGILLGDNAYWGRGIGSEATELIIDYAFNSLGLAEIELGVIAENLRAIRSYEKVGFKKTGVKEKAVNHNGVLYDDVIMVVKKQA